MSQGLMRRQPYGVANQLLGMEDTVMAWTTDAKWIAAHSTLAIVFILACAYIPA
jgi:hypothetical protein